MESLLYLTLWSLTISMGNFMLGYTTHTSAVLWDLSPWIFGFELYHIRNLNIIANLICMWICWYCSHSRKHNQDKFLWNLHLKIPFSFVKIQNLFVKGGRNFLFVGANIISPLVSTTTISWFCHSSTQKSRIKFSDWLCKITPIVATSEIWA